MNDDEWCGAARRVTRYQIRQYVKRRDGALRARQMREADEVAVAKAISDVVQAEAAYTASVDALAIAEQLTSERWAALQAARREGQRVLAANGVGDPRALLP